MAGKIDAVHSKVTGIARVFDDDPWTTATINIPVPANVCTYTHRDVLNDAGLVCVVNALGNFDHTKGGHLVLWELGLVLEFPVGCSIIIPSATITHSNCVIEGDNAARASFVQYLPGGILQYVENGFQTDGYLKTNNRARYDERTEEKKGRWVESLSRFSKYADIVQSAAARSSVQAE